MRYKKIFLLLLLTIFVFSPVVCGNALEKISNNLGVSAADIILIILTGGIIVFAALDVRIALMLAFLLYASVFIVFTLATEEGYTGFNPYYSGVAMMCCFVLLALSLLITYKKTNSPPSVA